MSQELLAIIEQIERERGIKKEVLIEAVESALVSAVKKVIDLKVDEEIKGLSLMNFKAGLARLSAAQFTDLRRAILSLTF